MGRPPISTSGLGIDRVCSWSLVPRPPHRITTVASMGRGLWRLGPHAPGILRSPVDAVAPEVTVAIPVKDRRERMLRCLDAVLAQDHPSYEVLVLDNGSTDGTAEV